MLFRSDADMLANSSAAPAAPATGTRDAANARQQYRYMQYLGSTPARSGPNADLDPNVPATHSKSGSVSTQARVGASVDTLTGAQALVGASADTYVPPTPKQQGVWESTPTGWVVHPPSPKDPGPAPKDPGPAPVAPKDPGPAPIAPSPPLPPPEEIGRAHV